MQFYKRKKEKRHTRLYMSTLWVDRRIYSKDRILKGYIKYNIKGYNYGQRYRTGI